MFAGPLGWMYTYGAGLQQAPGSIGFEHIVFAPPGAIIKMAAEGTLLNENISAPLRFASASKTTLRGEIGIRWYLPPPPPPHGECFMGAFTKKHQSALLQCPNHLLNPIQGFAIASFGNGTGNCSDQLTAGGCSVDLTKNLTALCKGHPSCSVLCDNNAATCIVTADDHVTVLNLTALAGSGGAMVPPSSWRCGANTASNKLSIKLLCPTVPKPGHVLTVEVEVPPNSDGVTKIPLLGTDPELLTIVESGSEIWSGGTYDPVGAIGVISVEANMQDDVLEVKHGSGRYHFVRIG